ncbi:MAG: hypothetical protein AAGF12_30300 [Myxococcota bacterium]
MRLWGLLALAALLAAPPAEAMAQSDDDRANAQAAFQRGIGAAREGRWDSARRAFAEAYEHVPRPVVLINLAGAERQSGLLVEALRTYERFQQLAGEEDAQHLAAVQQAIAEVRTELPLVTLEISGLALSDDVRIDGEAVSAAALSSIPVNPGSHEVVVQRDGETVARGTFEARVAQRQTVALAVSVTREPDPLPEEPEDSGGISPWVWVGIGAGVLVIAGTVVAILLATGGSTDDPFMGNFGPGQAETN